MVMFRISTEKMTEGALRVVDIKLMLDYRENKREREKKMEKKSQRKFFRRHLSPCPVYLSQVINGVPNLTAFDTCAVMARKR